MASIDLQSAMRSPSTGITTGSPPSPGGRTTLTFSRDWLVHIANQTIDITRKGKYVNTLGAEVQVADALKHAMDQSVHYHSSHVFAPSKTQTRQFETQYRVWYGSSLNVATQLQQIVPEAHVGILNSASGKTPGGKFFRGTISQEDCICRASLLYPCLVKYVDRPHHFYVVNNKPKYQQSNSTCAIYSPLVPIIRQDTVRGELLNSISKFSFVSTPAPNAFVLGETPVPKAQAPGDSEAPEHISLNEAMRDRCFRTLCIFAEQNCTDLVLCAFGCGVHGNDPVEVAAAFRDILATEQFVGRFRTIAFAIQPSRHHNYKAFVEAFQEAEQS